MHAMCMNLVIVCAITSVEIMGLSLTSFAVLQGIYSFVLSLQKMVLLETSLNIFCIIMQSSIIIMTILSSNVQILVQAKLSLQMVPP